METDEKKPRGIIIIGILHFFIFLSIIMQLKYKMPFLGTVLEENAAIIINIIYCCIFLYIGVGFLKWKLSSWYLFVIFGFFEIFNFIINKFTLSEKENILFAQSLLTKEEMMNLPNSISSQNSIFIKIIPIIFIVLLATIILYVYKQKKYFA